jgi:peptidoglycan-associated lipoprotein
MKKVVFFLLFQSSFVYGQKNGYTLSGIVTDCKAKDFISGVLVKLVGSDGSSVETKTGKDGFYFFDSTQIHRNTEYVVTTHVTRDVTTEKNKRGYLNASDKVRIHTYGNHEKMELNADFCLVPNEPCTITNLPIIIFEKKSVEKYRFDPNDNSPYDDLRLLSQFLNDNTNLKIQIKSIVSSKDKFSYTLAKSRAELIQNELIKLGVAETRLFEYLDKGPNAEYEGKGIISFHIMPIGE